MDPAGIPALIEAIRHMHGCEAKHLETVHVHERTPATRETVWEGDVEVFALSGHPSALRAYAWSEATTGSKRRFFAVIQAGSVTSAAQAVQASILTDARGLAPAQ
jgi:hypothetical protein